MRYIKVLLLVCTFFLGLVFLFQNQGPLSQELTLKLHLLAIPAMESIKLPFYFIVLVAFLLGAILSLILLLWDRMRLSGRLMKARWRASNLEKEADRLYAQMKALAAAKQEERAGLFQSMKTEFLEWRKKNNERKAKRKIVKKRSIKEVKNVDKATKEAEAKALMTDSDLAPNPDKQ